MRSIFLSKSGRTCFMFRIFIRYCIENLIIQRRIESFNLHSMIQNRLYIQLFMSDSIKLQDRWHTNS